MSDLILKVAARLLEAKKKTFDEAKKEIMDHLKKEGWDVAPNLKVPHATSPDGEIRVWFKSQAVYMSQGKGHSLGGARSMHSDIRTMDGPAFVKDVEHWAK